MRLYHFILIISMLLHTSAYATPATLESLYTNPEGKRLPEAVIFYSTANTCENCHNTIDTLISVLRKNYKGKLHAYLINTAQHPEFISAFNLKGPLNLTIIRISDGAAFGYQTLPGIESLTPNLTSFSHRITEFINNFLGF